MFTLVNFNRKTGRIIRVMDCMGIVMLSNWAKLNTRSAQDTMIFVKHSGEVREYYEGQRDGIPKLILHDLGCADDYCPGLLEAVNK